MTKTRIPANAFHVGEYIREEMEARGMTIRDLASKSQIPEARLALVLAEIESVTADIADGLERAFPGTNPQTWLNLQEAYDALQR